MAASAMSALSGADGLSKVRVLVLDDDAFDRKRVRRWIERHATMAVDFFEAKDLAEFSERVAHQTFDVVFLDYALADGTGLDAVASLRRWERNAACQTVIISGRDEAELQKICLSKGCDQFLSKSVIDGEKINAILEHATRPRTVTENLATQRPSSALEYWTQRAHLRAQDQSQKGALYRLESLKEAISRNSSVVLQDGPSRSKSDCIGADHKLIPGHFVSDFIECDEFEFLTVITPGRQQMLKNKFD